MPSMTSDDTDPPGFTTLAAAAVLAVSACATAFQTDRVVIPADADDERLWPPVYDTEYDRCDV